MTEESPKTSKITLDRLKQKVQMMILLKGFLIKITLKKLGETSVTESIDITLSNAFLKKGKKNQLF
jgi:hypothetical protein